MPGWSGIWATRAAQDTASAGQSTVEPGTARSAAMSSSPIWDGPSGPISTPACEPTSAMSARDTPAIRMKSYARDQNAANVAANGR